MIKGKILKLNFLELQKLNTKGTVSNNMNKIIKCICVLAMCIMVVGCGSKDPKTVVLDAITNNDGEPIKELIEKSDDLKELMPIINEGFNEKHEEFEKMDIEEFKKTKYASILDLDEFVLPTQPSEINESFAILKFFNSEKEYNPDDISKSLGYFFITLSTRWSFNKAIEAEAKEDYLEAYLNYDSVSNLKDSIPNDVLIPKATEKAKELESKAFDNQGIEIEFKGAKENRYQNVMDVKYTNNTNRDIKTISGYYVAYDKDGYPLPVDGYHYHAYFSMNDNILKKGKSTIESAFPDVVGMKTCKFLITNIEYLNGGVYQLSYDDQDKILDSWEKVVVNKK